ncbi:unnamed protein product [Cuscuta europaea]|uniref:Uncharacterized protein n=1 Tax=Cuscuta europaea TaxID=41803 RepID=A0A9P0ZXG6_CUSEU|nr:unnamed protein product [Cuscuta europaea]
MDAGTQKPAGDFFKKSEGPSTVPTADAAAAKRKAAGKAPEGKKPKKGDTGNKDPPVVIVDEHSASGTHVEMPTAEMLMGIGELPSEVLQVSLPRGTAVMNCTVDPRVLLRGMTPEIDRAVLGEDDDVALEDKILRSSLTACIALSEQARRREDWRLHKAEQDAKMKELVHQKSDSIRQMAALEESLRHMTLRVEVADRGKAEAERSRVEAIEKAAKEAEAAKAEAVAKAREEAISGFLAEGWKAEGHKQWLCLVVESSVDEWCDGPSVEWVSRKGKQYYDGGEFFTQALIYRRMAHHLKIEPKDFDPAAYGLPLLQPDVRVPLPPDVERPDLEDTELTKEAEGDGEEAGVEVTSKPVEEENAESFCT